MKSKTSIDSIYRSILVGLILWLTIWYVLGSFYIFITGLPSITIWSIEESMICEGSNVSRSCTFREDSIGHLILFSIIWPVILAVISTLGLLVSGYLSGYEYSLKLPLMIILYYVELFQNFLPIFLIGYFSSFIVLILVLYKMREIGCFKQR